MDVGSDFIFIGMVSLIKLRVVNTIKFSYRFLKLKTIPFLFWSSPKALIFNPSLISVIFLVIGLILFGLGEALLIAAGLGVSPWTVLAQGITNLTGWTVGFATFVTSSLVLLCWIPLKQTPGIGTILNAIIIALVLDFLLPFLPKFNNSLLNFFEIILGIIVTGLGGGIYLIANLGPGPRDGLMTGLQSATNLPIAWVRSGIELSVIAIGWTLGGTVGVGTVLFALGIGPSVAASMYILSAIFEKTE